MKITELLNAQPTGAETTSARKLDMASLDLFAAQRHKDASLEYDAMPQRLPPVVAPLLDGIHTAPTISPTVSGGSSTEDERETATRKRRSVAKPRKGCDVATNPLAALADIAVEATDEPTKRRARAAPVKAKGTTSGGNNRASPMTNEEKRAKQRMLVKKSYYRKINTLNTLRQTVSDLEKEYTAVVQASQQNQPKTQLPRHSISALVGNSTSPEGELRQSFQDMAVTIDRLRHENEGLRAVAMEQSKARTRVGILVHEEIEDQQKRAAQYGEIMEQISPALRTPEENAEVERARASPLLSSANAHAQSPERLKRPASPIIHMNPMTEDECIDVARDAYDELLQFRKSKDYITSGGHVFGWRDRRRLEGDQVQFALEKTFLHTTAEQLATNTWSLLSTERGVNRIYSSSVRATYHLVQYVSDHNVIFYRTIEHVDQNVTLKSLILASFVQTETGYMILFRSIDPRQRNVRDATPPPSAAPAFSLDGTVSVPKRKEMWVDMFSWGVFEPTGPNNEHCTDFFGGFVPATVAANSAFWLMEVLLIAVRCESECVGPLFILEQPDNEDAESTDKRRTRSPSDDVVMEIPYR